MKWSAVDLVYRLPGHFSREFSRESELSDLQVQIVERLCWTNGQIALDLGYTRRAITRGLESIYSKLGCGVRGVKRVRALTTALREGIVSMESVLQHGIAPGGLMARADVDGYCNSLSLFARGGKDEQAGTAHSHSGQRPGSA